MEISNLDDILTDIVIFFENFCIQFNQFAQVYFIILKFLLVIVLIGCGILTLLKARGFYFKSRAFSSENDYNKKDQFMKPRLIVGIGYIVIGFGILFNYFTYFLIWVLDPIPDRLVYSFISLVEIDPYAINRITDIRLAIYPHEETIYYAFATLSFGHTIHLAISIWYLLNKVKNPRDTFIHLLIAVSGGIMFGFTTFMPLML
jgi:hypothetical protein